MIAVDHFYPIGEIPVKIRFNSIDFGKEKIKIENYTKALEALSAWILKITADEPALMPIEISVRVYGGDDLGTALIEADL